MDQNEIWSLFSTKMAKCKALRVVDDANSLFFDHKLAQLVHQWAPFQTAWRAGQAPLTRFTAFREQPVRNCFPWPLCFHSRHSTFCSHLRLFVPEAYCEP